MVKSPSPAQHLPQDPGTTIIFSLGVMLSQAKETFVHITSQVFFPWEPRRVSYLLFSQIPPWVRAPSFSSLCIAMEKSFVVAKLQPRDAGFHG